MKGAGDRRVAITGYGVVAPCGIGKEAFWEGLLGPGTDRWHVDALADWDPTPVVRQPEGGPARRPRRSSSRSPRRPRPSSRPAT